jgi:hypothetical protein
VHGGSEATKRFFSSGKTESDEELSTLKQTRPGPNGKDIQQQLLLK